MLQNKAILVRGLQELVREGTKRPAFTRSKMQDEANKGKNKAEDERG